MWECPQCGRSFINRNQHHGCLLYDVERHFERRDPLGREVFDRVCEILDSLGDYTILGQKTWIAFQVRALFFFLKPRVRGVEATFVLPGLVSSPRFVRTELFSSSKQMHRLVLRSMEDLDAEFEAWLREAFYAGS
ncbi:MAG: DUF5655 domain-containing protein [Fimbriimonadales bacterium]